LQHVFVGLVLVVAAALTPAVSGQAASCNTCGVTTRFDQSLACWNRQVVQFVLVWTQREIAGWRHPAELEPPLLPDGHRDFRRLNGLLQQPHAALGPRGFDRPVWHCAVRAAPEDKMLSDDEWAQIAGDIVHRTGLAPYGQEYDAVRWVAVRHGDDHIHVVAMLARQDGGKPRLSNERYRGREACRAAEERYGLRRTAPGTGPPPVARPARRTRRPSAAAGRRHPGSR
jgi:hypothetical protein